MLFRQVGWMLPLVFGLASLAAPIALGSEAVLARLARKAVRVADDVPVRQLDDVVQMAGQRPVREAMERGVEAELRRMGKLPDSLDAGARARIIVEESPALMARLASGADPSLLRQLDQADNATRLTAFTLARGGDRIADAVPDLARRAELLERGGAPLVTSAGIHGPDFMNDAMRLDALIQSGRLLPAPGLRSPTLADFGVVMAKTPEASATFWSRYVRPNWKWWAGGTALGLYLVNPEYFQTALGELTEKGAEHITAAGGAFAGRIVDGMGKGAEAAGRSVVESVGNRYFHGWESLYAWLGTGLFLFFFSILAWPRGRKWFWARMGRIWRVAPKPSDSTAIPPNNPPSPPKAPDKV